MYSRVASYGVMKSPPEVPSPKALFSTLAFHIHQDSPKARLCWSLLAAFLFETPPPKDSRGAPVKTGKHVIAIKPTFSS